MPSKRQLVQALPYVRQATAHLVRCWDALREAEQILGYEITVCKLAEVATDVIDPRDADQITSADVDLLLEGADVIVER